MAKPKRLTMNGEQSDAFLQYYSLGDSRTLKKVAGKVGKNQKVVERWSYKYRWQEKIQEMQEQLLASQQKAFVAQAVKEKEGYRALIRNLIGTTIKELKGGKRGLLLKVKTPKEVVDLIKLDLLILGEATERTEMKGKLNWSEIADRLAKRRKE